MDNSNNQFSPLEEYVKICLGDQLPMPMVMSVCRAVKKDTKMEVPTLQKMAGQSILNTMAAVKDRELYHLEKFFIPEISPIWTYRSLGPALQRIGQVPGEMDEWGMDIDSNQLRVWKGDPQSIIITKHFPSIPLDEIEQVARTLFDKDAGVQTLSINETLSDEQTNSIKRCVDVVRFRVTGTVLVGAHSFSGYNTWSYRKHYFFF